MVAPPLSIERHPFIVVRHGDRAGSAEQLERLGLGIYELMQFSVSQVRPGMPIHFRMS